MSDEVFRAVARELGDGFPPENVLYPVNARLRASYPDGLTIADIIDVFLDESAVGVRTGAHLASTAVATAKCRDVGRLDCSAKSGTAGSDLRLVGIAGRRPRRDGCALPSRRWARCHCASSRGTPGTPPNAAASTTSIGALTSEF